MARPALLVVSRFLLDRRDEWDDHYDLLGPDEIAGGELAKSADRVQVIVSAGEPLDRALVDALPNLKLVACFSTGYAGIDLAHLRERGIALTSAAGVNAHDVADHAIALCLAWWHGLRRAELNVRARKWKEGLTPRPSLRGKRAGIVGLGRIGREIARRAEALGLIVSWWGPREKPQAAYPRAASLVALARDSDILFVAARAVAAGAGQIDSAVLAALGPDGVLVNVSRGFLIDEPALLHALEARIIAGAALDVFAREPPAPHTWERFENVVLSPHIAGYTREAGVAMFGQLRENIRRHFAGEPLLSPVEDAL
ncbi:MAG TPA: NAD(P)-dependent oxidoreductase [Steroidobacteraceae bacterium]|nr:NAD(P)-dependent oxidoreductase [Steroidobacteraceae bacterium]